MRPRPTAEEISSNPNAPIIARNNARSELDKNTQSPRDVHMFIFDPNRRTMCQYVTRFVNTLLIVTTLLFLTMLFSDFHYLLLIDGAILTNILMIMLPNALYLYQCSYGYLKYQESYIEYFFAMILFYFSIFNVIYAAFRGV